MASTYRDSASKRRKITADEAQERYGSSASAPAVLRAIECGDVVTARVPLPGLNGHGLAALRTEWGYAILFDCGSGSQGLGSQAPGHCVILNGYKGMIGLSQCAADFAHLRNPCMRPECAVHRHAVKVLTLERLMGAPIGPQPRCWAASAPQPIDRTQPADLSAPRPSPWTAP